MPSLVWGGGAGSEEKDAGLQLCATLRVVSSLHPCGTLRPHWEIVWEGGSDLCGTAVLLFGLPSGPLLPS